ncbi:hypothetical protein GCM10028791_18480 [Echinicola sediminis]
MASAGNQTLGMVIGNASDSWMAELKDFQAKFEVGKPAVYKVQEECFVHVEYKPAVNGDSSLEQLVEQWGNKVAFAERIFSKRQTAIKLRLPQLSMASTNEGSKKTVMTLGLEKDSALLQAYKEVHQKVWPEIIENMNTMGIYEMELFIHGFRVFMVMETKTDFDLEQDAESWSQLPREKEWQKYVSQYQNVSEEGVRKWKLMEPLKWSKDEN